MSEDAILVEVRAIAQDVAEIKVDLKDTKAEVKQTNGRVHGLEIWKARVEGAFQTAQVGVSLGHPLAVGIVVAAFTFGLTRLFT